MIQNYKTTQTSLPGDLHTLSFAVTFKFFSPFFDHQQPKRCRFDLIPRTIPRTIPRPMLAVTATRSPSTPKMVAGDVRTIWLRFARTSVKRACRRSAAKAFKIKINNSYPSIQRYSLTVSLHFFSFLFYTSSFLLHKLGFNRLLNFTCFGF